jgi:lysophospholipase
MAAKKKKSSSEKQLKSEITKLKARLKRANAKAAAWKKKAKRQGTAAAASKRRVAKLEKELATARRTAGPTSAIRDQSPSPAGAVAPETTDSADQLASVPDESWTVVRLRAEARARGLTGMSGKSKAELLAGLR